MSRNVRIQIGTALVVPLLIAGLMYFDPGSPAFTQKMRAAADWWIAHAPAVP